MSANLTFKQTKRTLFSTLLNWRTIALVPLSLSMSFFAHSQEKQWWFDIEVVVYKRNLDPASVVEQFPQQLNQVSKQVAFENLKDYLYPDLQGAYLGLPICFADPQATTELSSRLIMDDTFGQFEAFEQHDFIISNDDLAAVEQLNSNNIQNSPRRQISIAETGLESISSSAAHLDVWQQLFSLDPVVLPETYLCRLPDETAPKPFIEKVPKLIDAEENPNLRHTQLLSADSLELNELARDINRQRGLSTMLHLGWRQQVTFGQDKGLAMHLFAGENFGKQYDKLSGLRLVDDLTNQEPQEPIVNFQQATKTLSVDSAANESDQPNIQADLITQIKLALDDENYVFIPTAIQSPLDLIDANEKTLDNEIPDIWELDGNIKVFLRYINRTPYLHIDGNLDYRAPVFDTPLYLREQDAASQVQTSPIEPERLQSYPFSQLRRVISKQFHYFDHPMFGMIIQIRRYDLPATFAETKE